MQVALGKPRAMKIDRFDCCCFGECTVAELASDEIKEFKAGTAKLDIAE